MNPFRVACLLPLFLFLLLLSGCTSGPAHAPRPRPERRTWLVVLDLSDRLLLHGQATRDTALVGAVARQFLAQVALARYIGSADRLRVVVAPQAGQAARVDSLREDLTVDMAALPVNQRREAPARVAALLARVGRLYAAAQAGRRRSADFAGTDLWHYFRDQLPADLRGAGALDTAYRCRHSVVVLTDGYFDFEDFRGRRVQGHRYASTAFVPQLARLGAAWADTLRAGRYGLLPIALPAPLGATTTVTVAEVNPRSEYEDDILATVWADWLRAAGVQTPPRLLLQATPLTSIREQLVAAP